MTRFKFFTIPVHDPVEAESELNAFLRSHRVIAVHRQFLPQEGAACWCMAVEYLPAPSPGDGSKGAKARPARVDYKDVLSPEDFAVFVKLRDWRKKAALEEGVPVYTVFTNEQLAAIVQKKIKTKKGLHGLDGVGDARVTKYGDAVIKILAEILDQKGGEGG